MSNSSSKSAWPVKFMRWAARLLSVVWTFWALFWTWFVLTNYLGEGLFSLAVYIIIMITALLMFLGAAIIASVWRKEALGGRVLLVDGVLIIASGTLAPHSPMLTGEFWLTALGISTMVLPPLAAGSLFLICHHRSKTSG